MTKNISAIVFVFIMTSIFIACTSYDSNKLNYQLIQGRWILVDVNNVEYDTIEINYTHDSTYLVFDGNTCSQYMPDLNDSLDFSYTIHNYSLSLYKDSTFFRKLNIMMLTKDSLILIFDDSQWKYKRIL